MLQLHQWSNELLGFVAMQPFLALDELEIGMLCLFKLLELEAHVADL